MTDIKDLLTKEMTRQEFLKFSVGVLISLFGVGNLIKYMSAYNQQKKGVADTSRQTGGTTGFGSSKFGV